MKGTSPFISFLLLIALIYYSFYSLMPSSGSPASLPLNEFSTERALIPLKEMSKHPHYIGSEENYRVQEFLMGELRNLGLEPETQEGYILNEKWGSMDKPVNITAKIKGKENGKALLIFSHYDSALVPSFGASDAGSGVVTILESLRAYLSEGKQPKNDIIILFTDGEEVGLDGAKLFVREHRWAKDVALALNFEARGSGGPSNMIVETNQGNQNLIKAFSEANPKFPVASSLMYSIYKVLPNDTDSTILREEGDIDGFFFAFIDDHFDYHTSNDNYERLDRKTLEHQGSYLLPLMHYFGDADLTNMKSETDDVYVNFPFIKMISYPFSWVIPMVIIAAILFILLVFYGLARGRLSLGEIGKGFIPFLLALVLSGLFGYYGWKLLLKIYPQYLEIQQGFTYNGHTYIALFVVITLAITFGLYKRFGKQLHPSNLMVAPLFFWLLINFGLAFGLKGGAFFIIPFYFGLLSLWVLLRQEFPNLLLMLLLAVPAIFIFSPLVQFFPVGLGLKMLVASCIFTVLIFGLLLPVIGFYKAKRLLSFLFLILGITFFISAHFDSKWTEFTQKPNSLLYYEDTDNQKAVWLTYDLKLDDWTKSVLGESPSSVPDWVPGAGFSKYNKGYSFASEAPFKNIPKASVVKNFDTIFGNQRSASFTIIPQRDIDVLRLSADSTVVMTNLKLNGVSYAKDSLGNVMRKNGSNIITNFLVAPKDTLRVEVTTTAMTPLTFNIQEFSFNLLNDPSFNIPKRPINTMTKPFVYNDAVVLKSDIDLDKLMMKSKDTTNVTAYE